MSSITTSRWVLLRLVATPWVGLGLPLLLGLIPLQQALAPLPSSEGALSLGRLWAQPAGTLGVLAGLVVLSQGEPFLARLDPRSRRLAELTGLLTAGLILLLPVSAGALLGGARPPDLVRQSPAILASLVHHASLALLLLQPVLSMALRISLFVTLAWLLPALCTGTPSLGPLVALVDANGPLRAHGSDGLASSLVATIALLLSARLVRR